MKRAIGAAVGGLIGLDLAYGSRKRREDAERFPPAGRLVDVGGHRLHVRRTGSGGPAVVIENGSGALSLDWYDLQDRLSSSTTVVTYDRAGYAWSEAAAPRPRPSSTIVRELRAALRAIAVPPPYVLVGHSLGGFHVRVFAGQYPDEVAGVVLVDSSHPDQMSRFREVLGQKLLVQQLASSGALAIAPMGLLRLAFDRGLLGGIRKMFIGDLQGEEADRQIALYATPKFRKMLMAETLAFSKSAAEVRAAGSLGDRPLAVLTAGISPPLGSSDADRAASARIWTELQDDLARLSTNSEHAVVADAGHFIQRDQPDAVFKAIDRILEELKSRSAVSFG
jgi:pimeloyl-ACP methyl ester carboxylesterase